MRGCPFMNRSRISSRIEGTPAMRKVSSTIGVMIVTGCARLIIGSRNLLECILTKCAQYTISTYTVQCSIFESAHTFVAFIDLSRTLTDNVAEELSKSG